jgi:HEAT repeat protein
MSALILSRSGRPPATSPGGYQEFAPAPVPRGPVNSPAPPVPGNIPGTPANTQPPRAEHLAVFAPSPGAAFPASIPWASLYLGGYKDQPRLLSAAELDKLLADLRSDKHFARIDAAKRLGQVVPVEGRRGEVSRTLEAMLGHNSPFDQEAAAHALAVWGTAESVPALIKLLDDRIPTVRAAAMDALVALHDDRAIEPIARRLADSADRSKVRRILEMIGPAAERAVIPHLSDQDKWLRIEACHILQTIGSQDSTAALEAVVKSAGRFDQDLVKAAKDALSAIAARQSGGA